MKLFNIRLFFPLLLTCPLFAQTSVCIEDEMSLRAGPEIGSKLLTTVSIGEEVTLTGQTAGDYVKVRLSGGEEGWTLGRVIVSSAKTGVLAKSASVYSRPNLVNATGTTLEPLTIVAVVQTMAEWTEVVECRVNRPSGSRVWLRETEISYDSRDRALSVLYQRANSKTDFAEKDKLISMIRSNSAISAAPLYGLINKSGMNAGGGELSQGVKLVYLKSLTEKTQGKTGLYISNEDGSSKRELATFDKFPRQSSLNSQTGKLLILQDNDFWIYDEAGSAKKFVTYKRPSEWSTVTGALLSDREEIVFSDYEFIYWGSPGVINKFDYRAHFKAADIWMKGFLFPFRWDDKGIFFGVGCECDRGDIRKFRFDVRIWSLTEGDTPQSAGSDKVPYFIPEDQSLSGMSDWKPPASLGIMDQATGKRTELLRSNTELYSSTVLSPDGRSLAFRKSQVDGPKTSMFIIDLETKQVRQLPIEGYIQGWNPGRIFYQSYKSANEGTSAASSWDELRSIKPDGSDDRLIDKGSNFRFLGVIDRSKSGMFSDLPKSNQPGICIEDAMSLRSGPSSQGTLLGTLAMGEEVTCLGDVETDQTSGLEYWKVKTTGGTTGWTPGRVIVPGAKRMVLASAVSGLEAGTMVAVIEQSDKTAKVVVCKKNGATKEVVSITNPEFVKTSGYVVSVGQIRIGDEVNGLRLIADDHHDPMGNKFNPVEYQFVGSKRLMGEIAYSDFGGTIDFSLDPAKTPLFLVVAPTSDSDGIRRHRFNQHPQQVDTLWDGVSEHRKYGYNPRLWFRRNYPDLPLIAAMQKNRDIEIVVDTLWFYHSDREIGLSAGGYVRVSEMRIMGEVPFKETVCLEDQMSVREQASGSSPLLGRLAMGQTVEWMGQIKTDGHLEYWKIRTNDGLEGWALGKTLVTNARSVTLKSELTITDKDNNTLKLPAGSIVAELNLPPHSGYGVIPCRKNNATKVMYRWPQKGD